MDVNVLDRRFRWGLLTLTLLLGLARFALEQENAWVHAFFIILMAGNVGYFTNYLAIKMLFQPKQGKVLGWAGLVPKNKPQIARSLAESVQQQLLSPDVILAYIHQHQLIETGSRRLTEWVDRALNEDAVRERITTRLADLLRDNGDEILGTLFEQAESLLKELASDPRQVQLAWDALRTRLARYLDEPDNRARLVEAARGLLNEELPRLAGMIDTALERYLREREAVGTIGMGLKRMFSIDRNAIERALDSFVNDPESSAKLVGVLDAMVSQLLEELDSPQTRARVLERVESWVAAAAAYAHEHLLPLGAERLRRYLDDERSWTQIDNLVLAGIGRGRALLDELMQSQQGQATLKAVIGRVVRQLDVTDLVEQQVMRLDTDELEALILDNTGGNLVVIQILGGSLGLVAGLVQVDIRFAFPLLALVAVAYLAFQHNRRKYRQQT